MPSPSLDGRASTAYSLASTATSRRFSHGMTDASSPDVSLLRRCPSSRATQRPVRMNIASPDVTFTPAFLFPRLEILDEDPCAGLQVWDTLQRRNIHQHAAGDDAGVRGVDGALLRAIFTRHFAGVEAVVDLAVEDAMAERVEMGVRAAVIVDGEPIHRVRRADRGHHAFVRVSGCPRSSPR